MTHSHPSDSQSTPTGWTPLTASKRVFAMPLLALSEEGRARAAPQQQRQHGPQQRQGAQQQQQQAHAHHAAARRLLGSLQSSDYACNDHRCCAERRLIEGVVVEARRRGVRPHKVAAYVRRRLGGGVWVVRLRQDGSLGCSAPCMLCARELAKFDLKVACVTEEGRPFLGRLSDPGAPAAKVTSGQRSWLTYWAASQRGGDKSVHSSAVAVAIASPG